MVAATNHNALPSPSPAWKPKKAVALIAGSHEAGLATSSYSNKIVGLVSDLLHLFMRPQAAKQLEAIKHGPALPPDCPPHEKHYEAGPLIQCCSAAAAALTRGWGGQHWHTSDGRHSWAKLGGDSLGGGHRLFVKAASLTYPC
jgi:hypothetical protein